LLAFTRVVLAICNSTRNRELIGSNTPHRRTSSCNARLEITFHPETLELTEELASSCSVIPRRHLTSQSHQHWNRLW
jgi:hypothetical protein